MDNELVYDTFVFRFIQFSPATTPSMVLCVPWAAFVAGLRSVTVGELTLSSLRQSRRDPYQKFLWMNRSSDLFAESSIWNNNNEPSNFSVLFLIYQVISLTRRFKVIYSIEFYVRVMGNCWLVWTEFIDVTVTDCCLLLFLWFKHYFRLLIVGSLNRVGCWGNWPNRVNCWGNWL